MFINHAYKGLVMFCEVIVPQYSVQILKKKGLNHDCEVFINNFSLKIPMLYMYMGS